jgi:hypothetical protein
VTTSVTIGRPGQFKEFERYCTQRLEKAALRATQRAAKQATNDVRAAMRSAGLGRLSNAIGSGSDLTKTGTVHREGERFSASGWIHIRGRSPRTLGAIESFTEGTEIGPKRGKWLAIVTQQIQQKVGRKRMTPDLYRSSGLEQKLGPLVFIQTSPTEALLVVENVSVDKFARAGRRARALPKSGRARGARRKADFIVAFVLIRRTSRAARVNPNQIIAANAAKLPALMVGELRKEP